MLKVENLTKHFGGVAAVSEVSFTVGEGAVQRSSGRTAQARPALQPDNRDLPAHLRLDRARRRRGRGASAGGARGRGVARTFQNMQLAAGLSAIENVMLGAHLRLDSGLLAAMIRWPGLAAKDRRLREKAAELMAFVGCGDYVGAETREMPYGALKRLEIARAIAAEPKLLFLDQPAAGLNPPRLSRSTV